MNETLALIALSAIAGVIAVAKLGPTHTGWIQIPPPAGHKVVKIVRLRLYRSEGHLVAESAGGDLLVWAGSVPAPPETWSIFDLLPHDSAPERLELKGEWKIVIPAGSGGEKRQVAEIPGSPLALAVEVRNGTRLILYGLKEKVKDPAYITPAAKVGGGDGDYSLATDWWIPPARGGTIVDRAGQFLEHTMANEQNLVALFEDGSLQILSGHHSIGHMFNRFFNALCLGALVAFFRGCFRYWRASRAASPDPEPA